ncbi:MAG: TatD family hydrolase [Cellvibrionaceae bacterium]|nr:TatD family hydrolase [Cellvibrionaceae bacterium]
MIVDSHCHLDRLNLEQCGGSLAAALEGARADGVSHMLCVCISEENRRTVLDIAAADPGIFASAGVHPSDVGDEIASVETLKSWCDHRKVVALGETGLDYYYARERSAQQKVSFANHLQAAADLHLPVIVHTRDAREDTMELIRTYGSTDSAGVMHCFTESWEMACQALDLGYYISISGIVTFRNADDLRAVAQKVPMDRLLVETDSPYLAPIPYRGKSNQPRYVRAVAEYVADLRGVSLEYLAEQTSANFFRLFKRAQA